MKSLVVMVVLAVGVLWWFGDTPVCAEQARRLAQPVSPAEQATPTTSASPATSASHGLGGVAGILEADQRYRRQHQLAVQAYGGSYLGPSAGSSFITGARLLYWVTRMIGVGAGYSYAQLAGSHDLGPVSSRQLHIINGQLELSMDASLRLSSSTVLEADLFGTFGGGAIWIADGWRPTGLIGGGLRVYPGPDWLAIRVEVLNWLHMTPLPGGDSFEADLAFTLTLSFLVPPRQAAWRR